MDSRYLKDKNMNRIIGIDASTTCIGWCIFEGEELIDCGKIKPNDKGLEWRDRIQDLMPQLSNIMEKYNPSEAYIEDVPLMTSKGKLTLVQLGAVQGAILGVCSAHKVDVHFLKVSEWRGNIGLYDGTAQGKERDKLKQHSIEKANKLFGLDLKLEFTKGGNYSGEKSDDDIADAILIAASTMDKYKIEQKTFGRKSKIK